MTSHYAAFVDSSLALELQKLGIPVRIYGKTSDMIFAEVFDWFLDKGISIEVTRCFDFANEQVTNYWEYLVIKTQSIHSDAPSSDKPYPNWLDAATDAVKAAVILLKQTNQTA